MGDVDWRGKREEEATDTKRPRVQIKSGKVLHVRALPAFTIEQELVDIVKSYGECTKVLLLQDKNQAFVEMKDSKMAADVLAGLEVSVPMIRNKRCYWQYSDRPEIEAKTAAYVVADRVTGETQGSAEGPPTTILLSISEVTIPVTLEAIHQVGSAFGTILRIITFNKGADYQALLEYASAEEAERGRQNLDGKDLYENCCHIRATFSNKNTLTVKQNDHRGWDYTIAGQSAGNLMQYPPMYYGYTGFSGSTPMEFSAAPQPASSYSSFPPSVAPVAVPSVASPSSMSIKCEYVDCFTTQAVQGVPAMTLAVERKTFDDLNILPKLAREVNALVVFYCRAVESNRADSYDLSWVAPGWKEGEDPHSVTASIAAAHSILSNPRSSRSFSFTPRNLRTPIPIREELENQVRVYWSTMPLSPDDAFTDEPWLGSPGRDQPKAKVFLQGLGLELNQVASVERNAKGVVVVATKEESTVRNFASHMVPGGVDRVTILVLTTQVVNKQRPPSQDRFESLSRVFVSDENSCLKEDYGGASAAAALSCFWFSKTSKVLSFSFNPSGRSSTLRTRLLASGPASSVPFDRVEIGASCRTTLTGNFMV